MLTLPLGPDHHHQAIGASISAKACLTRICFGQPAVPCAPVRPARTQDLGPWESGATRGSFSSVDDLLRPFAGSWGGPALHWPPPLMRERKFHLIAIRCRCESPSAESSFPTSGLEGVQPCKELSEGFLVECHFASSPGPQPTRYIVPNDIMCASFWSHACTWGDGEKNLHLPPAL